MAYESTDSRDHPVLVSEDFRTVRVPRRAKVLGCVGDRRVRRVWFEVPRYCDGTDMAGFDVQVHYVGADGTGDWYPVTDAEAGEDAISFSWVPGDAAFGAEGEVRASVRMVGDGREFNSAAGTFSVLPTLREEADGSPLADGAGDMIVITVAEGE